MTKFTTADSPFRLIPSDEQPDLARTLAGRLPSEMLMLDGADVDDDADRPPSEPAQDAIEFAARYWIATTDGQSAIGAFGYGAPVNGAVSTFVFVSRHMHRRRQDAIFSSADRALRYLPEGLVHDSNSAFEVPKLIPMPPQPVGAAHV